MMTDHRADQQDEIANKLKAHRAWLVSATANSVSLTSVEYAKWRSQLRVLEAEEQRLALG